MKTESLEPFPPNTNPFLSDPVRMRVQLGTNVMAMLMNHANQRCERVVLVDIITGERILITFSKEIG